MIFCDTSTAVKIYVPEPELESVRRLFDAEAGICLSELARVEIMGVFHKRLREGSWNNNQFLGAVRQFSHDDLSGFWTWLTLDQSILHAAAEIFTSLPSGVFLRSSDCIHLVTALRHDFAEIYTYDRQQAIAASVLGLKAVSIA